MRGQGERSGGQVRGTGQGDRSGGSVRRDRSGG